MSNPVIPVESLPVETGVMQYENPQVLTRRASDVAGLCREIVLKTAVQIQGRKYVKAEGWLAIATAHGCIASSRDVERVEGGYKAIGEIKRIYDGMVLAVAEGFVGEDEPTWFGGATAQGKQLPKRADYAIRAMTQTRAISRVCRAAFAHVVVLMDAGLQTTPAEEVPAGGFDDTPDHAPIKQPKEKFPKRPGSESELETGDWREVQIHFGKNKGIPLGKLEPASLAWYQNDWKPKPFNGKLNAADVALRAALDASMKASDDPFADSGTLTIQEQLANELKQAGVSFDNLRAFMASNKLLNDADSVGSIEQVPEGACLTLARTPKLMAELVKKFGKQN